MALRAAGDPSERGNSMSRIEEKMKCLGHLIESAEEYNEKSDDLVEAYLTHLVVPTLKEVLNDLYGRIKERHRVEERCEDDERPMKFTHYTSINTLVSMIQNTQTNKNQEDDSRDKKGSSLRLYDSAHFNDPDEGDYLIRTLGIQEKYKWLREGRIPHAYIASFIIPDGKKDMDDNLVFWRAYGNEGEGCSLSLHIPTNRLYKVLYGRNKVEYTATILLPILDRLDELLDEKILTRQSTRKKIQEALAGAIWSFLERIAYLYKSDAYNYENECRFIVHVSEIPEEKIHFEYGEQYGSPARIRHYYEDDDLSVSNILVTGSTIILGPRVPHPHNVEYCLNTLLRRAALYGPKIKISGIRYRKP